MEARRILKGELARKDIDYKKFSKLLLDLGIDESPGAITNKLSRGSLSFAFFLQCMKVIGRPNIQIALD
ncbi:DUF6471 domain-containing protein [Massilia rubra]|uniref:DUF6471 domain-containing protein n=1 Tax=Massilia rubra TaxID=2607910 RepID=A0ABX0LJB9_9BURK|nr:DUF6471 domain-containing protein [Massilia rubra]NHZ32875.1 hypothetical protein [Massilia rubra]